MRTVYIIRAMMEAVGSTKPSVCVNDATWRYIPRRRNLYTRRREKLKSHVGLPLVHRYVAECLEGEKDWRCFMVINFGY
jgi:hypothetical protein